MAGTPHIIAQQATKYAGIANRRRINMAWFLPNRRERQTMIARRRRRQNYCVQGLCPVGQVAVNAVSAS
jgi:hypothetical protein